MRAANVLDHEDVVELAKQFPSKKASRFLEWFLVPDALVGQMEGQGQ